MSIGPNIKKTKIDNTFTFTATVKNAKSTVSYQWQYSTDSGKTWKNFTLSSATTSKMALKITTTRAAYWYRCRITTGGKTYTSNNAIIYAAQTVRSATTAEEGKPAIYTVKVWHSGGNTTYQWQYSKDGGSTWTNSTVAGNKTTKLTLKLSTTSAKYKYRCRVTGKNGTVYSNAAQITMRPSISIGPNIKKTKIDNTFTFTATVKNASGTVTYQWQYSTDSGKTWKNFTLSSATTSRMALKITTTRAAYWYRCKITASGKTYASNTAVIYAVQAKRSAAKIDIGKSVTYSVSVWHSGGNTAYQWQYSKDGGQTWTNSGATGSKTAKLAVTLTESGANTRYRCKVSGKNGTVYTKAVYVTPNPRYYAVVIANSDYHNEYYCKDLPGCYKDGTAVTNALKAFGYSVKLVRDQTASGMDSAIAGYFKGRLSTDVCLVYYTGHGDDSYGSTGGSLIGVDYGAYSDMYAPTTLRDTLLNNTKGRVIVMLDSCGSGATVYESNAGSKHAKGNLANFTNSVVTAFSGYLAEDLESNTGELLQKRFTVLAACEYGETSMDGYYVQSNGRLTKYRGGAFTYSLLYSMGCSYPGGSYSGKMRADSNADGKLTLQEACNGIKARVKAMNNLLTSQSIVGHYSDGTAAYFCYDENGNDSYGSEIEQLVQMGGSTSAELFKK